MADNCGRANVAPNLINASDEKFERFFEKLYRLDKQFLASFIKNTRLRLNNSNFTKEFYSERGVRYKLEKSKKTI